MAVDASPIKKQTDNEYDFIAFSTAQNTNCYLYKSIFLYVQLCMVFSDFHFYCALLFLGDTNLYSKLGTGVLFTIFIGSNFQEIEEMTVIC